MPSRHVFDADSSHNTSMPSSGYIKDNIPPFVPLPPLSPPSLAPFREVRVLPDVLASPLSYAGSTIPVPALVVEKIFSDKFKGG